MNEWKNSHPLAENNQFHQAEVMQFSYQNTRVVDIRSVFWTIHRSTTLAPNIRAQKKQWEQIKFVKRLVSLTELDGEKPSDLGFSEQKIEASTPMTWAKFFKCVQEFLPQLETLLQTRRIDY